MIQGTTKEFETKYLVNGVNLDSQEWYTFVRVLERCGVAHEIGKQKNPGAGRQSKILQMNEEATLRFTNK